MANEIESASYLLSREELLLLLDLLEAENLPGLDPDPLGELNDDQRALALIWAGRALRARELAAVGENGELLVDEGLLTAVGNCLYWQKALFVFHWPEPGSVPVRFFGYTRDGQAATHSRPADVLHRFSTLASADALVEAVTAVCQSQTLPDSPAVKLTLPREVFVHARELAEEQDTKAAQETLQKANVAAETAQALTAVLAGRPRLSIWHLVQRQEDDASQTYDFTLLQNEETAWLVSLPAADGNLEVRTVTAVDLQNLLAEFL